VVIGTESGGLCGMLGIERALVQAPVAGCATPRLVAAVAEAGGIGTLACTWTPPAELALVVASVRELTQRPFAANLVLWFDIDLQLDALLALAVPVVTFSWGQPGRERVGRCHAARATVAVQVGSAEGARQAREAGADVLIAQGVEAGGHVQSTTPLAELLGEYRSAERVMIVGHEPDFSSLIGDLTGGSRVQLKKGGLARVDLESVDTGAGTLIWLLPPVVLRKAG